jgi:hypothetical protein
MLSLPVNSALLPILAMSGPVTTGPVVSPGTAWPVFTGVIVVIVVVVAPAVWSKKPARRRAALTVLDRLISLV